MYKGRNKFIDIEKKLRRDTLLDIHKKWDLINIQIEEGMEVRERKRDIERKHCILYRGRKKLIDK